MSYCGYIALIGRPNVGKSTLLNQLLGQKISITSAKPQTTRHRVLGISTKGAHQLVYVDTPGIHHKIKNAMNRVMNKTARYAIKDVDVIVFLVDGLAWKDDDNLVLDALKRTKKPVILAINKVDTIKDKNTLLPQIAALKEHYDFAHILPISAKTGFNIEPFERLLCESIPEGPHLFYPDQVTDRSQKFMVSEFIREKIFRLSGQELPYSVTIEIEAMKEEDGLVRINALILVEKESHKRMIIGKNGEKLKEIGSKARVDIEKMLDKKVFLALWVKVKQGWSDDERALKQLGYD